MQKINDLKQYTVRLKKNTYCKNTVLFFKVTVFILHEKIDSRGREIRETKFHISSILVSYTSLFLFVKPTFNGPQNTWLSKRGRKAREIDHYI